MRFAGKPIRDGYKEADFFNKVDCALGNNAHKRIQIKCKGGNLVDIYVNLPLDMKKGESLGDIVQRAGNDFNSTCNGSFKVDPIGFIN